MRRSGLNVSPYLASTRHGKNSSLGPSSRKSSQTELLSCLAGVLNEAKLPHGLNFGRDNGPILLSSTVSILERRDHVTCCLFH
jgi:hypothetical protein